MPVSVLSTSKVLTDALGCVPATLASFRAFIFGPQADLHRYAIASEKAGIKLDTYDPLNTHQYLWPNRATDSIIDADYVKLWFEDAHLNYFNDYVGIGGTVTPVFGYTNRVLSASDTFTTFTNVLGTTYSRSATLYDRDVRVGDAVFVRGTVAGASYSLSSTVSSLVNNVVAATTGAPVGDAANSASQSAATTAAQVAGTPVNDIAMAATGTNYESSADGYITRTYTILVTQSSTGQDATTAKLSVTSADGGDNVASVTPVAFGSATTIGTKGLTVTFSKQSDAGLQAAAVAAGIAADDLVAGQKWTVTVSQLWTAPVPTDAGTYTGPSTAKYIVNVTKGGQVPTVDAPTTAATAGAASSGGSLANGTYYAVYTFVNANGETYASPVSASFTTSGSNHTIVLTLTDVTGISNGAVSISVYLGTAAIGPFYQYKTGVLTSPTSLTTALNTSNPLVPTTNTCTAPTRVGAGPQISVSTSTGIDQSGPTTILAKAQATLIGNYGVSVTFDLNKLRKGDIYYITATAQAPGAVQTLVLSNDLPSQLTGVNTVTVTAPGTGYTSVPAVVFTGGGGTGATATAVLSSTTVASVTITDPGTGYTSAPSISFTGGGGSGATGTSALITDMDLRLFIKKSLLEISNVNLGNSAVNWTQDQTYVTVDKSIQVYDPSWTNGGVQLLVPVTKATVYAEYREWITSNAGQVLTFSNTTSIASVLGVVDPDNPISFAVFKALQNTPGTAITSQSSATSILNNVTCATLDNVPTDPTHKTWTNVLDLVTGIDGVYNLVPLSSDPKVQALVEANVIAQSDASIGLRRAAIFSPLLTTALAVVNSATTTDGSIALGTIVQDQAVTAASFTVLKVTAGNAHFVTNGVKVGDTVRYLYTVNSSGNTTWTSFTVSAVLSEDSLRLTAGPVAAVSTPQKVEVWHNLSKDDVVTEVLTQASGFANTRVELVWPDQIATAGLDVPGYFACAALAGLYGAVPSHQSLTNVQLLGFDSVSRSTSFLSAGQIGKLVAGGVKVITQASDGTVYIKRDVTTDTSTLNNYESMVRRNADMVAYSLLIAWAPYIGYCNNTAQALNAISNSFFTVTAALKSLNAIDRLGPPVYSLTINALQANATLADRIDANISMTGPMALNGINLTILI